MLGGGIVACELAQFLNRIGTRVCVVQRNKVLLRHQSEDAARVVRQAFEDEGIEVHTGTPVAAVVERNGTSTGLVELGAEPLAPVTLRVRLLPAALAVMPMLTGKVNP